MSSMLGLLGLSQSLKNGRGMGRAGLPFTTAIQGQPSLKAEPIRPFLASLTNFATGPTRLRPSVRSKLNLRYGKKLLRHGVFGYLELVLPSLVYNSDLEPEPIGSRRAGELMRRLDQLV